jgi:hypothetical protein
MVETTHIPTLFVGIYDKLPLYSKDKDKLYDSFDSFET